MIEKGNQDQANSDRLINGAYASRHHGEIAGEAVNITRDEWQISRVYAISKKTEPCLYHADRCLEITLKNNPGDFDLTFTYETMASAGDLAADDVEKVKYITLAKDADARMKKKGDRIPSSANYEPFNPNRMIDIGSLSIILTRGLFSD